MMKVVESMSGVTRSVERKQAAPLVVASGGTGAAGELLARTVLAQFKNVNVPIQIQPHLHEPYQIDKVVASAAAKHSPILHTMVNPALREYLVKAAAERNVPVFDLAGPVLDHLATALDQDPQGVPGLYRQLHQAYYQRMESIEFAVAHDDGKRVEDLPLAEIVLIGVSRVGKTPLSMYLSMLGWKVANVPLVMAVPPPELLFAADAKRVFGLAIEPSQLLRHRQSRQGHLGLKEGAYFDRSRIAAELRSANHLFYKHGFTVIDVTDKPIETTAEEIVSQVSRLDAPSAVPNLEVHDV
jgi:regulator of PEP synthase PpsR (kinase-PPPase family)